MNGSNGSRTKDGIRTKNSVASVDMLPDPKMAVMVGLVLHLPQISSANFVFFCLQQLQMLCRSVKLTEVD